MQIKLRFDTVKRESSEVKYVIKVLSKRKTKKGPDVSTSLFAFSLLLSSLDVCVLFFFFFFVFLVLVLFRFCFVVFLSFVSFYLYLICCLLK